jgi:uncharacterized radical SAM superfamily Fe-S cluster-containing enzyme
MLSKSSVQKTCIHIVHPDGRLIPFDTYDLFYRDQLEQKRLAALRLLDTLGPDDHQQPGMTAPPDDYESDSFSPLRKR